MKVAWADEAVGDLDAIHEYIGRDSAYYAKQFVGRILVATRHLSDFPEIGRRVPEAEDLPNVREILFEAYRIQYRIESERVLVVAVIHGSRDLSRMPRAPWEVD